MSGICRNSLSNDVFFFFFKLINMIIKIMESIGIINTLFSLSLEFSLSESASAHMAYEPFKLHDFLLNEKLPRKTPTCTKEKFDWSVWYYFININLSLNFCLDIKKRNQRMWCFLTILRVYTRRIIGIWIICCYSESIIPAKKNV